MRKLDTRTIVVASHNAGKIAEIADLIGPFGFSAKSAKDLNFVEPDETGTTFEENAAIKALASAKASAVVPSAGVSVKWMRLKKSGSPSTCCAMRSMIDTASIGQAPAAVSADNITASAPS